MKCFLCNLCFSENDNYFSHLKSYHFLKHSDTYRCCGSIYRNASDFKRHVRVKHKKEPSKLEYVSAIDFRVSGSSKCNYIPVDKLDEAGKEESENYVEEENVDETISDIFKNLLKFQTSIYSNINICRSDAESISKTLKSLIIDPLMHLMRLVCKDADINMHNNIFNFTEKCSVIFKSLSSEHLLKKKTNGGRLI